MVQSMKKDCVSGKFTDGEWRDIPVMVFRLLKNVRMP